MSVFAVRGAIEVLNPICGQGTETSRKTDTIDESDRPDIASDGVWLGGAATTNRTDVSNEQDRPDAQPIFSTSEEAGFTVLERPAAALSDAGNTFLERLIVRSTSHK
jgi:hypothetical protein